MPRLTVVSSGRYYVFAMRNTTGRRLRPSTRSLALALSLVAPRLAVAHDLWVAREGGELVLRLGHEGQVVGIDASRVTTMRCVQDGAGRDLRSSASVTPQELRVAARCDALSARFDGGFWTLTPDGEKNLPKSQVPDAVRSWASRQFAKWIDARAPQASRPLGDELEIVPADDLSRAREGDKIAVRVLVDGKPAPGAIVSVGHKTIGETDRRGEVRLRIRSKSLETVGATVRRPLASRDADTLVLEATLSFEVAR